MAPRRALHRAGLFDEELITWVDDGHRAHVVGRVRARIDMVLALIARLNGRDLAVAAARNMEYIWNEDPANDPSA